MALMNSALITRLLIVVVLTGAVAAQDVALNTQGGSVYLQTPSSSGAFFFNELNVNEVLRKVNGLADQVALVVEENASRKVCVAYRTQDRD
jgi:uridylate kinase